MPFLLIAKQNLDTLVAGHARFQFDIVSALFNIPRDSLSDVLVQVTSQVFYVGSKKRDFNDVESEEVVTEFLVDGDGNQKEVYSVPVGIRGPKTLAAPGATTAIGFGSINLGILYLFLYLFLYFLFFISFSLFPFLIIFSFWSCYYCYCHHCRWNFSCSCCTLS